MKNTQIKILLALFSVAMVSCKKDPLPELPDANAPYYSIRGLVNGDSINWVVGLDNTTITYGNANMNGIPSYYGQINCGTADKAVRIEILEPEVVKDGNTIAAVKTGDVEYLVHKPGSVKFNFGLSYGQFNYVLVKNEANDFVQLNQVEFDEYGMYDLTLKFTDYSVSESFVFPVRYGFENEKLNAGFQSYGQGDTLIIQPATAEAEHHWYLDGQLVCSEAVFEKELADGIYQIRHEMKDAEGNTADYTTLVRMKDGEYEWQMKYYYLNSEPSSHYGTVIVSYYQDGQWYRSDKSLVNLANPFTLSNVETRLNAELKPISTIFDFAFGTTLWNETHSDSLYLPEMLGSLSVGFE